MHDNLADILIQSISFGGDVDTVATMALGAASCSPSIENNIPQHLKDGLEDGTWGQEYLLDLDARIQRWLLQHRGS
jgi:ADP-ribosylglycohydrolase